MSIRESSWYSDTQTVQSLGAVKPNCGLFFQDSRLLVHPYVVRWNVNSLCTPSSCASPLAFKQVAIVHITYCICVQTANEHASKLLHPIVIGHPKCAWVGLEKCKASTKPSFASLVCPNCWQISLVHSLELSLQRPKEVRNFAHGCTCPFFLSPWISNLQ